MDAKQEESKWVRCPTCSPRTRIKVNSDTTMFNFPLFGPKCKKETIISVFQLKMVVRK